MADAGGDLVPGAMTEYLTDEWGFFIRSSRAYERFRSPYQAVEVHETEPFGKLFRLDGHFMTSEQDEFFYHETLVHMAGITHPSPERALIVGGGDGGSAEELLKYPSIKKVTLAEIDVAVVDVARKYFASVHKGALRRPAARPHGSATASRTCARRNDTFDLIVLDLTDPGGPSLDALHARVLPRMRGAPHAVGRDDAAHREPRRASRAHPPDAREPALGVRDRHAVPRDGPALRRTCG